MFIIIIGCGRFGSNLAKGLSEIGVDVCVIERDTNKLNALGTGFNGRLIRGIEFDRDNLIAAGIESADAIISVTADDNINITVSLIAEQLYHVPRIIARVNEPSKAYLYEQLGITAISPIQYEIELLKSMLPFKGMEVLATLDNNYEVIEFIVNKEKSVTVVEVEEKFKCCISGIMNNGIVRLANNQELIHDGDKIFCTVHKEEKGHLINYLCKEIFI